MRCPCGNVLQIQHVVWLAHRWHDICYMKNIESLINATQIKGERK